MPLDEHKVSVDCDPDELAGAKVAATVRAVAREARGVLRREGTNWLVVCGSEADAQFAALRLATEVDGIAVEVGNAWRVELVRERAAVLQSSSSERELERGGGRTAERGRGGFGR